VKAHLPAWLEAGKAADVIAIALDTPTPINEHNVYDQLVLFRGPADVTDVMAAGRWLKREGRILTIDPSAALERPARGGGELLESPEIEEERYATCWNKN